MSESFDDLAALYRADAPPAGALVRAVRRGRLKLAAGLVIGVGAALFTSVIGLADLWAERDAASALFAAIQVGIPVAVLVRWLVSSRAAWRASGFSTAEFLRLEVERRRHEVRMLRFGVWLVPVLVPALLAWQILFARAHLNMYAAHPERAVIGFGGAWVILGAVVVFGIILEGRKARSRLAAAQEAQRANTSEGEQGAP